MPGSDQYDGVKARVLAAALEPTIGQVYFAPEAHHAYEALGFGPSPGSIGLMQMPDGAAYFTSRGSLMGHVAPSVVAAAFGVFNPAAVEPAVAFGWTLTDAATIRTARSGAAVAQLQRCVGTAELPNIERARDLLERAVAPLQPEGRPLFAGARYHHDTTSDAWTQFFSLGDALREYRGDSHTAAWITAGVDAQEINLISEHFLGIPPRTYARSRAWSDAQFDAAAERLIERGWFDHEHQLTVDGRARREAIESATDAQMRSAISALGDDFDELIALLRPWGIAIRACGGYPASAADIRRPQ